MDKDLNAKKLAKISLPNKFAHRGYDIEIVQQPYFNGGLLGVWVKASKDGRELFVDNPLLYKNPPTRVPNGSFRIGKDFKNRDINIPNFVENPEKALKEIIIQTVEVLNK